jgi:hypothetical protein
MRLATPWGCTMTVTLQGPTSKVGVAAVIRPRVLVVCLLSVAPRPDCNSAWCASAVLRCRGFWHVQPSAIAS